MSGNPAEADDHQASLALEVHEILCRTYDCPIAYFHSFDPLSELISSVLSHRTRNRESGKAFKALREHFPTWELVRDAPVDEVIAAISPCTWPELKGPRIQRILGRLTEEHGILTLDFLRDLSIDEARRYLETFEGVGPKTSAAVLSFSTLRKPALPVDSHHHRVAMRLGLIPEGSSLAAAHKILAAQLPSDWNAQQVYDNHEVMMLHGQRCCYFQKPACSRCPVSKICPTGRRRLEARSHEGAITVSQTHKGGYQPL